MSKKKKGKHLQFYIDCISDEIMPQVGLCSCAFVGLIDGKLLLLFKPEDASIFDFWASGIPHRAFHFKFTELRQTIVLFMAAIAGEL